MPRPPRGPLELQEAEGRYIFARTELALRLGRRPTIDEIADELERSPRTVDAIRARFRAWQRSALAAVDADTTLPVVDPESWSMWTVEEAITRELYVLGQIDTKEAARRLGIADEDDSGRRELRRWRAGVLAS